MLSWPKVHLGFSIRCYGKYRRDLLANLIVLQKQTEDFSINTELWLCQMLLKVKYDEDLKLSTVFSKMMVTGNLSDSCFVRVMGGGWRV